MYHNLIPPKKLEHTFRKGDEIFRLIAEHSEDMIKVTDIHGNVEYASPSHFHILGYNDETDIFHNIHPDHLDDLKNVMRQVLHTRESKKLEMRKRLQADSWIWVETACSPVISDDGSVHNLLFITREISERKKLQDELERMAYSDFLTGLYNRRKLRMALNENIEESARTGDQFAFLIMDLDKFKSINDTYGHDIGDAVLQEFARRLLEYKRESDIVGRLGGDEFAIVMKSVNGSKEVSQFIQNFQNGLNKPCYVPYLDNEIQIHTSVGYSIYPAQGDSSKELFRKADLALYMEKHKKLRNVYYSKAKII